MTLTPEQKTEFVTRIEANRGDFVDLLHETFTKSSPQLAKPENVKMLEDLLHLATTAVSMYEVCIMNMLGISFEDYKAIWATLPQQEAEAEQPPTA